MFSWFPLLFFLTGACFAAPSEIVEPGDGSGLQTENLRLGGWLDFLYTDDGEQDGRSWRVPHIYLYADIRVASRWRAMLELSRVQSPSSRNSSTHPEGEVERLYLEYKKGIPLKMRLGKFNIPAGLWKQVRWSIMVDTTQKPLIEELRLIPDHGLGLELFGKRMFSRLEWNYSLFGTRADSTGVGLSSSSGRWDYGLDLNGVLGERWQVGLFFHDFVNDLKGADLLPGHRRAWLIYSDLQLVPYKLQARFEFLNLEREAAENFAGYYGKLKWLWQPELFINYRYDRSDFFHGLLLEKKEAHTVTLGYWPLKWLRLRAEATRHRLISSGRPTAVETSFWVGILF